MYMSSGVSGLRLIKYRSWLVYWLYTVSFAHLAAGIFITWCTNVQSLGDYHQTVVMSFWSGVAPTEALQLQIWWLRLFGATLQNIGLLMLLLTYLGDRYCHKIIWLWMMVGLLIWAPQDMYISLQANVWMNIWVDITALLLMLPFLFMLFLIDRKNSR